MRNRKISRFNKEKIAVIASSLLIVTACTITGVYINGKEKEAEKQNVVDFAALESGENSEQDEVAQNDTVEGVAEAETPIEQAALDQDLDSDPYFEETNSDSIINPMLGTNGAGSDQNGENGEEGIKGVEGTEEAAEEEKEGVEGTEEASEEEKEGLEGNEEAKEDESERETDEAEETMAPAAFSEADKLSWPVNGDVLMNYSMDQTIHFATLNQYKYNPAIVIQGEVNANVKSPAVGTIKEVGEDNEIGQYVIIDLGNGYELTLGQLNNITVKQGSNVSSGEVLGTVGEPSKYYSIEGSNVYMKLTKDGSSVNPMNFLS